MASAGVQANRLGPVVSLLTIDKPFPLRYESKSPEDRNAFIQG